MKKLLILLILSFFSLQIFAGSCPDGSDPVKSISADGTYFVFNCGGSSNNNSSSKTSTSSDAGIDMYGGRAEIPEDANPNYQTLYYFLDSYLNEWDRFYKRWPNDGYKYIIEKSSRPYSFESDLRENKDVKNEFQKTALLSYLLYENGKIVVDEITPKERFGELFNNQSKLHSQSAGKSITSYIMGHAICDGYISSIDAKIDDWPAAKNTLYNNQKIINLLNMNAGDHKYVTQNGLINSNRWYNSYPVEDILQNEFRNSKKSTSKHNYHGFLTNLLGTYVLHKTGDDFQKLLNKVFQEKAQIEDSVFFLKQENATFNDKTFWNQFYGNRYDYLRVARAILNDWQQDTCVGKYLKSIYDTAIPKNKRYSSGFRLGYTKKYAGQFHTHFQGINRPIVMMDGFGGQIFVIDFERDRVIAIQAIHDNFNFEKLVYDVLSKD
jgi:CubicO group peptidase (beta-lactamase class C family)